MKLTEDVRSSSPALNTACVIVNFNGGADVIACLAAVRRMSPAPRTIFVVDNCSSDGSVQRIAENYRDVEIIRSATNKGFAGGVNLGIRRALSAACYDFVLLLNTDSKVEPSLLGALLNEATCDPDANRGVRAGQADSRGRVGMVGAVLVEDDGSRRVQAWGGGRVNLWTGMSRHVTESTNNIDYLSGACVLLSTAMLTDIGLFDESYFFYWEDTDLGFRARAAGWRLAVAADTVVRHAEGASLGRWSEERAFRLFQGQSHFMGCNSKVPALAVGLRLLHHTVLGVYRRRFVTVRGAWRGAWAGWGVRAA